MAIPETYPGKYGHMKYPPAFGGFLKRLKKSSKNLIWVTSRTSGICLRRKFFYETFTTVHKGFLITVRRMGDGDDFGPTGTYEVDICDGCLRWGRRWLVKGLVLEPHNSHFRVMESLVGIIKPIALENGGGRSKPSADRSLWLATRII